MTGSRLTALRPAAFGADPVGARLERILASPNYADGVFQNPVGARSVPSGGLLKALPGNLRKDARARRRPVAPVPVHPTTLADLAAAPASGLRLTWMGHSTVLAEIGGRRVLFDPVWGDRCSPFAFAGPKRVHPVPVPLKTLGTVDVVVISHDHYDHLDMPTIQALVGTDTVFAVPLGVGAHLEHWGIDPARLHELDWNESTEVGGLTLTATPARHFCGRGLRGRQQTLWASWVVTGGDHRIYHSGDTGYFPGFAEIGERHGPFDATMIQIGAYSEFWPEIHTNCTPGEPCDCKPDPGLWPDIHMTPDEGLRAHLDLQGGKPGGILLPIHWGTFNLAMHPWAEPGERTMLASDRAGQQAATPLVGQPFEPATCPAPDPWWRNVAVVPDSGWAVWPRITADSGQLPDVAVEA
ncbi:MBL fold metallo-hydrolase [Streptomyces sp. H39-S7]|uniref:MBL fold metallo-hydrolase n=1 Tax=Streptomyces sp. H39-S7 TaxID=3004357 RepID=UPI0022AE716B|nr:MBL fold metallo-hydrolase [Streptomyces sp. H39-S7]MCZ4119064.1 MBL fold metallo-hydrolase [Streptomyces sp. H39-S7]